MMCSSWASCECILGADFPRPSARALGMSPAAGAGSGARCCVAHCCGAGVYDALQFG